MSLSNLHQSADNVQNDIYNCEALIASLEEQVSDLRRIHSDMRDARSDVRDFRRGVRTFANESYQYWDGNLFREYQDFLRDEKLVNLRTVIDQISNNMVIVNNKRTELENEIFRQQGILGNLRATLNSIWTAIVNWVD